MTQRRTGSVPVALVELKPMLALFAQAIAGRAVALHDDGDAAPPRCDDNGDAPLAIVLPPLVDCFASATDNRSAYRIAVLRQASAQHGDASLQAALRAATVSWRRAFRALERQRIDAAVARRFPGARADLARVRSHELARRCAPPPRVWPATRALDALARHALGDAAAPTTATAAMLHWADALLRDDAGPLDSARTATRICRWLGLRTAMQAHAGALAAGDAIPALLEPQDPVAADATRGAAVLAERANLAAVRGDAGAGAMDAPASADDGVTTPASPGAPPLRTVRPNPDSETSRAPPPDGDEAGGRRFAIDEWDYRQQRLVPDWCTLIERRQHGGDIAYIRDVRRRHATLARRVHRQFATWRPEGLQRVHGADDGDEVELDRVVRARVERRAGLLDDAAWYVRRDRGQRDVATALLLDTSASTDFVLPHGTTDVGPPRPAPSVQADAVYLYDLALAAPPPTAPKRRVIDVAKEALALMCDALHALGDCFAVYTFSGHGRAHVDMRVVKSFAEAVSSRTAGAIASLRPHGATRTGAAIRHTTAQLLRQPQRQRALIVVTDGYPEDIDYGPLPRDLRYGLEDTAHALLEAQALGVQTFCLSIDPAGHDYLRRMCPPQRYLVIGDLAALPDELAKVYHALTRPTRP